MTQHPWFLQQAVRDRHQALSRPTSSARPIGRRRSLSVAVLALGERRRRASAPPVGSLAPGAPAPGRAPTMACC